MIISGWIILELSLSFSKDWFYALLISILSLKYPNIRLLTKTNDDMIPIQNIPLLWNSKSARASKAFPENMSSALLSTSKSSTAANGSLTGHLHFTPIICPFVFLIYSDPHLSLFQLSNYLLVHL